MSRAPKKREEHFGDRLFLWILRGVAVAVLLLLAAIAIEVFDVASPAFRKFGAGFLLSNNWDPVNEEFGALAFIYGTVVSSLIALCIAVPISVGAALFLTEIALEGLSKPVSFLIEMLAAIPSVIYGLWGIFVLAPWMRTTLQPWLGEHLGFIPLFSGPGYGVGMLTAGIILAIMITPTISAICREVFNAVPQIQREAALALGATRWEMIRTAVLKSSGLGIFGAVILGLGRALGETMAVTMVIGNRPEISSSLFAPAHTMASVIANEYAEAAGDMHLSALAAVGFSLFVVSFLINFIARLLLFRPVSGRS